jgi:ubiquinone/menaquinone biosynthesis C-methylase UbiE
MPHQFEAGNKEMLKGLHRREVQPAEEIVERASPQQGEVCADLGAGTGYISIPLSREVRTVIALDSQREMLDSLRGSIGPEHPDNIWTVIGELPELPFADGSVDRVFIVNVLHEFEDRDRLVQEVRRVLKDAGRVSLVDRHRRCREHFLRIHFPGKLELRGVLPVRTDEGLITRTALRDRRSGTRPGCGRSVRTLVAAP